MKVLATADLHYNHSHSRPLAEELIERMNDAGGNVLLVVGDTAAADGPELDQCLSLFRFDGPKLFVAGNHELWTHGPDSYAIFRDDLPRRVRALGWHWLQDDAFVTEDVAFVGSIGWYDYSFSEAGSEIPRRFYEQKVSPGAAQRLPEFASLLEGRDDVPEAARQIVARWNDGKFVKLHRSDNAFLEELLIQLHQQLAGVSQCRRVLVAIHHVPFAQLLPPARGAHWDFVKAFLGSPRIGQLLLQFSNVSHVVCGHSHFAAAAQVDHIRAINIGSGYRHKTFIELDID